MLVQTDLSLLNRVKSVHNISKCMIYNCGLKTTSTIELYPSGTTFRRIDATTTPLFTSTNYYAL